jgi:hypothetical protein
LDGLLRNKAACPLFCATSAREALDGVGFLAAVVLAHRRDARRGRSLAIDVCRLRGSALVTAAGLPQARTRNRASRLETAAGGRVAQRDLVKKLVTVLLALCACSTTSSVVATWTQPGAGRLDFRRVLVIAPVTDPTLRRTIENQAVAALPSGAVPSYRLAPAGVAQEVTRLDDIAQRQGFDAAVVVRVAAVAKEQNWVPGAMVFGAWTSFDPLDIDSAQVRVETSVYALPSERAVFSCASEAMSMQNLRGLVDDTIAAVRDNLGRPPPPAPRVSEVPSTGIVAMAPGALRTSALSGKTQADAPAKPRLRRDAVRLWNSGRAG